MPGSLRATSAFRRGLLALLLGLAAVQLATAEHAGASSAAPARTLSKLSRMHHILSGSLSSRTLAPLLPALQGMQADSHFVHRLRGGRRTMHDEDESDEDESLSEDEVSEEESHDEEDDSVSDSTDSPSDVELDPLDHDDDEEEEEEDEEELPESHRRHKNIGRKLSKRDELPETACAHMHDAPMSSSHHLLKGAEHRDAVEDGKVNMLALDAQHHVSSVTKSLQTMRSEGVLTDVHLVCKGGAKLPAHRALLAAASPQLRSMIEHLVPPPAAPEVAEKDEKSPTKKGAKASAGGGPAELVLDDVEESCAKVLLDFIYTGNVEVVEAELPALLGVSETLGVTGLRDACSQHLHKELSPENALRMRALGRSLGAHDLYEAAHHLIMEEFLEVALTNSFLELDQHTLSEIISSDDLLVNSEKEVLEAVVRWTESKDAERGSHLLALMSAVRLALLPLETLAKKVAACPAVQRHLVSNPDWQAMLNRAIAYVGSSVEMRQSMQGPQTRERLGSKGRFLVIVGGRKGSSTHALGRSWMLDRINYEWFEVDNLHTARKQLASAEADGKVYVAGGWDGEKYLRSVEMYCTTKSTWLKAPSMAFARGSFGLGGLDNGDLLAVGGFDGHKHLASVELFSAQNQNWTAMPPLNIARSGVRVAVVAGKVLAIGGFDGTNVLNTVEEWDAAAGVWKNKAGMLSARRDHAVCVVGNTIVVAGGFNGTQDLSTVEMYDPVADSWHTINPMHKCRSGLSLTILNHKLHALGGYDGNAYLSVSEAYDFKTDTWCNAPEASLPTRMAHFGTALL
eukprot:CAMPEP_0179479750 /NCGR_PEP_ID=MMETSP0799-20121207/57933_1 /TAXON_ID=46947 /ORGANISM="Geminigera cryophila, Strain CCMP2564" /LENGTH=797 /DNA_ID=CAMNT_0021291579 /DNA_START=44 /DNA_END=2437 /DNA_ORIENTATION=+